MLTMLTSLTRIWRIIFKTVPIVGRYYKHIKLETCVCVDQIVPGIRGEPHSVGFRVLRSKRPVFFAVGVLPTIREFNERYVPVTEEEALAMELMRTV
jgi:hypothetical protein